MQLRIKVGNRAEEIGWNAVKIFVLVMVVGALVSSTSRGLVPGTAASGPKTVIPAAIRPGRVDTLSVSFSAKLLKLVVTAGTPVKAGQLVAILESEDLTRQLASARRRVALAELRTAKQNTAVNPELARIETRTAAHALELARERLSTYSLTSAKAAYEAAKARDEKIGALLKQHMATAAEFDNAERDEKNELRNLEAAREHKSRLEQELEAAQLQSELLAAQFSVSAASGGAAAEQMDLADARAELSALEARARELQVTAPHDGVVLNPTLSVGDRVFAGSPILYVADVSRLSFEAAVSATLARQIRPGDAVRIRVPTEPPRHVDAQISSVTLAPDPVQQNYLVRAVIGNPDRNAILAGMEGAIEFPHSERAWRRPF